jgi:hypothetical protein
MWRRLPPTARRALYPTGYHLLLRDNDRRRPIGDILAWLGRPGDYLPSGADFSAAAWLEEQT